MQENWHSCLSGASEVAADLPWDSEAGQPVTSLSPDPFFCSSSGANVNAKDTVWLTPLHRAAASRNEVGSLWLRLLLAWGWWALMGGGDCSSASLFYLAWFWLRWVFSLEWRGDERIIERLKMRAGKKSPWFPSLHPSGVSTWVFPTTSSSPPFPLSPGLCLIQLYISLRDDGALTLSLGS